MTSSLLMRTVTWLVVESKDLAGPVRASGNGHQVYARPFLPAPAGRAIRATEYGPRCGPRPSENCLFAARLDTSRADRTIHAAWQPGQNSAADGSCAESVPLVSRDNMGSV